MVVLDGKGPNDINTNSDEVQLILHAWWNRDFYNRRRLYNKRLNFFKFPKEYRIFSEFALLLDANGLISDSNITKYITADEESRKEIVRRLKSSIHRRKIMP
jgi:dihydrodipicolinate synthase/N-acetylneuraminate lyase